MAIQNSIGILDTKGNTSYKKKKTKPKVDTSQILASQSTQGQKLYGTTETKAPTIDARKLMQTSTPVVPSPTVTPTTTQAERKVVGNSIVERNSSGGWTVVGQVEQPTQPTTTQENVAQETVTGNVQRIAPERSIYDIARDLQLQRQAEAERIRQAQIAAGTNRLNLALQSQQDAIAQQQAQLDPRYSQAKGSAVAGARIASRELAGLNPYTGQMAGTGVRQQIDVQTGLQGRQSELDALRQQEEADIASRGQQALREYQSGLMELEQTARADEALRNLQGLDQYSANILEQQRTEEEREFTLARDQAQALSQRERDTLLQQFDTESRLLDAQIQQARDLQNFDLEQQLVAQKAQNDRVLEGIRAANDMAQIQARGAQDRATLELRNQYDTGTETQQFYDDSVINASVSNFIRGASNPKESVSSWLVQNAGVISEEQADNIMRRYNLTLQDVQAMKAKMSNITPSTGM